MKLWRAIVVGLGAGVLAIVVIRLAGWLAGSDGDLCALVGVAVTGRTDTTSWLIGCAVQLGVAIVAAIVYAGIFEWVTRRAGALVGLVVAVPHVVIAGLSVGFLPGVRLFDAGVLPPGAFLEYRGIIALCGFIAAHLLFGVVVGQLYGRTRHAVPASSPSWREVTNAGTGARHV